MKVVGITGGTGSGKTSVLRMMERLGCFAIDADEVYHRLLRSSALLQEELKAEFPEAFTEDGLNRKSLGKIVYNNEEKMHRLNQITHPKVVEEVTRVLGIGETHKASIAVVDAILLIESGLDSLCDLVVGVVAPREIRMNRIMRRDTITFEQAMMRIDAQPEERFYRTHCDYIIENPTDDGTILSKTVAFYDKLTTGIIARRR